MKSTRKWTLGFILLALQVSGCGKTPAMINTAGAAPVAMQADANTALTGPAGGGAQAVLTDKTVPTNASMTATEATYADTAAQAAVRSSIVFQVSNAGKKVALTFDDGPDNKYTPQILDILKKHHVKATFFLVGDHAKKYPQMVKRIADEGHAIGNHSWDHSNLSTMAEEKILAEITNTDDLIKTQTGQSVTLFRAPYGAVTSQVASKATSSGHQIIGWSVDTLDWEGKPASQILDNVKKELRPGAIILQHSSGGKNGNLSNTVEALPQIITYLEQKGYSFETVSDLLSYKPH